MIEDGALSRLGQGLYWQDLRVGQKFATFGRTVTETDLVNFISVTGMLEANFLEAGQDGAMGKRPVPAALTYTMIEGFVLRGMLQGTGLALLEVAMKALKPVQVGDTISATVETTEIRPTSKGNRAVVTSSITVLNQTAEPVLTYVVKRLLAGRETVSPD